MSILVDENTKVLVQGITGNEGMFHARQMVDYGTRVVAGVTPGKGGQKMDAIPVFNTVSQAVKETGANASAIFVPPAFAADAILEAADAEIPTIVCLTEGIPTIEMVTVKRVLKEKG
jgi:succinyl-CoA synthetase alpha subunit